MGKNSSSSDSGTTRYPGLLESVGNALTGVERPVTHTTSDGRVGHGRTGEQARNDANTQKK